nr:MAG TPA_asm: Interferon antagonist C7-range, beta-sandwich, poxvirus, vaccinia, VIRAL [Caudoviricetes sp.]
MLGDSYGCVNHACGAIDPPSRVEYLRRESAIRQSLIRARHILW